MKKGVMVYGYGKLGKAVLEGLDKLGINLFAHAYNAPGQNEFTARYGKQIVSVLNSSRLTQHDNPNLYAEYRNMVSHIVVTLPGNVLEQDIYLLVKFGIPLIICSTGYDEILVSNVIFESGVPAVMSNNMALGIIDLWIRLAGSTKVPEGSLICLRSAVESHQSGKADVSGSALKTFSILRELGIFIDFDISQVVYDGKKDGKCGCFSWLREEASQLHHGVYEDFIDGHGYHSYCIEARDDLAETQNYIDKLYDQLKSLSDYTVEGIFTFRVSRKDNRIFISHNINGREIYSQGIYESMKFLDNIGDGIYSASDVVILMDGYIPFGKKASNLCD